MEGLQPTEVELARALNAMALPAAAERAAALLRIPLEVGILSGNDLSESGFEMKRKKVKQKIDRKNHTARDCAVVRSDTSMPLWPLFGSLLGVLSIFEVSASGMQKKSLLQLDWP